MMSSRNLIPILTSLVLATAPTYAAADVFYTGPSPAEACAEGASDPHNISIKLKRLCDEAIAQPDLNRKARIATTANAGIVHLQLGEYDEALENLETAARLDPDLGDIAISHAAALIRLDRNVDALDILKDIGTISKPKQYLAYYNRGLAYWGLDQTAEAYADFRKSIALKPDYKPAHDVLKHFRVVEN